jgi:hypothetical protein
MMKREEEGVKKGNQPNIEGPKCRRNKTFKPPGKCQILHIGLSDISRRAESEQHH